MLVYVVMHGSQVLLLEAAYRYTYAQVTLSIAPILFLDIVLYNELLYV
jgi:hypothetical protein